LFKLIAGDIDTAKKKLENKIVLLGYQSIHFAKATSNKDEFLVTASSDTMYGVAIHGNMIGNLIEERWLQRSSTKIESIPHTTSIIKECLLV